MEIQLFELFDFFRKKQRLNQRYRYDQKNSLSGFDNSDCRNFDVENVLFMAFKENWYSEFWTLWTKTKRDKKLRILWILIKVQMFVNNYFVIDQNIDWTKVIFKTFYVNIFSGTTSKKWTFSKRFDRSTWMKRFAILKSCLTSPETIFRAKQSSVIRSFWVPPFPVWDRSSKQTIVSTNRRRLSLLFTAVKMENSCWKALSTIFTIVWQVSRLLQLKIGESDQMSAV